jgi:hypothetical protein
MQRLPAVILPVAVFCAGQAVAQSALQVGNTDLSKETENPVTRQMTLPLEYEADLFDGEDKLTKSTLQIDQAVLPFRLNDDWALITRTKLPAEALPPKNAGDQWADGLGNGYTTFFFSPEHGQGFFWGAGPVLYYPATSSTLGTTKWGSGPSVAFLHEDKGPWVYGLVANNIWSFDSGSGGSNRTNELLLNPVVSYHLADGWAISSSPNITANWIANGNKWTVPIGGGVSKTFRIGEQPIKLALDAYYNAIRPNAGQDPWQLQATLTFIFPEKPALPILIKDQ